MKMVPEHIEPADWRSLINYWSSDDFQKKSSRNKQNRSKNKLQHAAGTDPFALRRYKNEIEGKSNNPLDLWFQNYTKKDSTFVNKHSQDIYEKVQSKKAEAYDENLGFREVYGPPKSGKVIGYGRGIRPSMVFPSFKSQASEALKKDNEELKEKVKLLTSEVGEMKEFLLALTGMQTHQNDEVQVQANGEDDSDAESLDELEEN
ncbi:unnamed protein product [Rhodiola kirilowii]